ncbi:50S ribosomal protein L10 [Limosilactobacillus sp. RRLNB_1_1]|mgnify:FL=1|uniref:Large ribosomal subunit protein uL10 n=2 Tax=Limosilactobacillus TaxID=2742598 RepID=A0A7W3TTR0_9LACO|nr:MULTISPECIES: 50S ribosomal protein L10 [Limosilactobacillus]MBC8744157.1 50S ribosomal protein L10 [Lactobacillus sp. Marseille-P7033]MRH47041.1 50S ribosomal protein L10 [Limosilactobacillus reuteri]MBB1070521.1 50S ribosomal protein L10 [Limosilactobacillus albertensis]MBB1122894.1 50S ribosomal protein L10 [Limosilactobacillus albertensis]MCD7118902.1 50S ribosomal protein L10 [Limosilactobacillus albertensis]
MSEAAIAKKAEIVKQTSDMLNAAQSAIVVDYRGLTVAEVTDLRKQLRDAGIKMSVIKNKILDRAVEGTDYEELRSTFVGPTAVAFSDEDPIAPAKILKKFADDHDALEIKGGFIEKSVKTLDEINEYANMPGREELLSMLASALQDPMRKIARAVKAVADKEDEAA